MQWDADRYLEALRAMARCAPRQVVGGGAPAHYTPGHKPPNFSMRVCSSPNVEWHASWTVRAF